MERLDSLLKSDSFYEAVSGLAREFRDKHKLGEVHQLGLVVPDVEKAAAELEARGIGPFFIASGSPVLWRERGEEKSFRGKLGIAYHEGFELELLEPGEGSDFYRECVDPQREIMVQHLGFLVGNVDHEARRFTEAGVRVRIRGAIKSGPLLTDFAYMDTMEEVGLVIEFISWKVFGRYIRPRPGLIHFLGRIEKLIGRRSVSI